MYIKPLGKIAVTLYINHSRYVSFVIGFWAVLFCFFSSPPPPNVDKTIQFFIATLKKN